MKTYSYNSIFVTVNISKNVIEVYNVIRWPKDEYRLRHTKPKEHMSGQANEKASEKTNEQTKWTNNEHKHIYQT